MQVELKVDKGLCVGSRMCVSLDPEAFATGDDGKAVVLVTEVQWGELTEATLGQCPAWAISADEVGTGRTITAEDLELD